MLKKDKEKQSRDPRNSLKKKMTQMMKKIIRRNQHMEVMMKPKMTQNRLKSQNLWISCQRASLKSQRKWLLERQFKLSKTGKIN